MPVPRLFRLFRPLALLLTLVGSGLLCANELPSQVRIRYDVLLGSSGLRVGSAEQTWKVTEGRYLLETRIRPLLGPRLRYVSEGRLTPAGLVPEHYAEYRNDDNQPRLSARFDWAKNQVAFGLGEPLQVQALSPGAQDVNAFVFQLAFLGKASAPQMQIATGRKLNEVRFSPGEAGRLTLAGKILTTRVWKSQESGKSTEVWLAPELGNLPVRVQRGDDRTDLVLVAQQISTEPIP